MCVCVCVRMALSRVIRIWCERFFITIESRMYKANFSRSVLLRSNVERHYAKLNKTYTHTHTYRCILWYMLCKGQGQRLPCNSIGIFPKNNHTDLLYIDLVDSIWEKKRKKTATATTNQWRKRQGKITAETLNFILCDFILLTIQFSYKSLRSAALPCLETSKFPTRFSAFRW